MPYLLSFALYLLALIPLFAWLRTERAIWIGFLAGWLLLPVADYPRLPAEGEFAYWITGSGLPSEVRLSKAWIIPVGLLIGCLIVDRRRWLAARPSWIDAPLVAWCLMPLVHASLGRLALATAIVDTGYLAAVWGIPWLLGRSYFRETAACIELLQGLCLGMLLVSPLAVAEGVWGPFWYGWVFPDLHPFRLDGHERYVGYRPLLFFENGNQYGLWVCLTALAAIWLRAARIPTLPFTRRTVANRWDTLVTGLVVGLALVSQAVGALALMLAGCFALLLSNYIRPRRWLAVPLAIGSLVAVAYFTGLIPFRWLAEQTAVGQWLVDLLKQTGRGSFAWRIGQDMKLLELIHQHPWLGSGAWDWWREKQTRPWGFFQLILGHYGLLGLLLNASVLVGSSIYRLGRAAAGTLWIRSRVPIAMAILVLLSAVDACLNAFLFHPSILITGILAHSYTRQTSVREQATVAHHGSLVAPKL